MDREKTPTPPLKRNDEAVNQCQVEFDVHQPDSSPRLEETRAI